MTGNHELPDAWSSRAVVSDDVPALAALTAARDRAAAGVVTTSPADVRASVTGPGAATRRHRVVTDRGDRPAAWAWLQDRAAGRVVVGLVVDPELPEADGDAVAAHLLGWADQQGRLLARDRGLEATQLDAGAFADDSRQHRWLTAAGYSHTRTWWQMSRPVDPAEGRPGTFPAPADGVVLRQLVEDGEEPGAEDLRAVHDVLETAFADHFNYHEETFEEFVERQRQEPGHAWDHWWLAELEHAGPVGALVAEALPGPYGTPDGSYVAYVGVTRAARGRGVAKALLHAVVADAARRGRSRVGLEVDADSPTGAARLYEALGFRTRYVTQSWHRDVLLR